MSYGTTTFRHTVSHEPYLGDSGIGEIFDDAADLRCRFRRKRRVLRSANGDEVVADAHLLCRDDESIAALDRITKDTVTYRVAEVQPAEGPHSGTNHLVVMLRAD